MTLQLGCWSWQVSCLSQSCHWCCFLQQMTHNLSLVMPGTRLLCVL